MAQGKQQGQQQQQQGQQQQGQQQQQQNQDPTQGLKRALAEIRQVQNMLEMKYPQQEDAIKMLREAGDLVWQEIGQKSQQQQG
jgi:hypothetical protein